jgi:hypothetical protein
VGWRKLCLGDVGVRVRVSGFSKTCQTHLTTQPHAAHVIQVTHAHCADRNKKHPQQYHKHTLITQWGFSRTWKLCLGGACVEVGWDPKKEVFPSAPKADKNRTSLSFPPPPLLRLLREQLICVAARACNQSTTSLHRLDRHMCHGGFARQVPAG